MDGRIDDYPSGQDAVVLTDPFDRHIHAAAVDFAGALVKSDCPAFADRITERCREIALDQ